MYIYTEMVTCAIQLMPYMKSVDLIHQYLHKRVSMNTRHEQNKNIDECQNH